MKTKRTRLKEPRAVGTIGFRLDEARHQSLVRRAAELGVSCHELARYHVVQLLSEAEDRAVLRADVIALQTEVAELRVDLAFAVEALLVSAGKVAPDEARAWVKENLKCSASPTP